eukprot:COSAG06_NODE_27044_length_602_cov_1.208748_2_plen_32_part_01
MSAFEMRDAFAAAEIKLSALRSSFHNVEPGG